jgi:hypothetical protein
MSKYAILVLSPERGEFGHYIHSDDLDLLIRLRAALSREWNENAPPKECWYRFILGEFLEDTTPTEWYTHTQAGETETEFTLADMDDGVIIDNIPKDRPIA